MYIHSNIQDMGTNIAMYICINGNVHRANVKMGILSLICICTAKDRIWVPILSCIYILMTIYITICTQFYKIKVQLPFL